MSDKELMAKAWPKYWHLQNTYSRVVFRRALWAGLWDGGRLTIQIAHIPRPSADWLPGAHPHGAHPRSAPNQGKSSPKGYQPYQGTFLTVWSEPASAHLHSWLACRQLDFCAVRCRSGVWRHPGMRGPRMVGRRQVQEYSIHRIFWGSFWKVGKATISIL